LKSLVGHFNIRGQVIGTVKYADDLVTVAKEQTVLHGVIDGLIEAGKFCGFEMNMEIIYLFLTAIGLTPGGSSAVQI
jgi:hypothetical protein